MSISEQASVFLLTVLIGFFIGFVYDLFRILRKTIKHLTFVIQIEDGVYWIFVSLVMFYLILSNNYGEVRVFYILGTFLGVLIYFLTLSQIFLPITVKAIDFIKDILYFLIKIVLTPVKFVVKLLVYPVRFLKNIVSHINHHFKNIKRKSTSKVKRKIKGILKEFKIILNKK